MSEQRSRDWLYWLFVAGLTIQIVRGVLYPLTASPDDAEYEKAR